MTITKIFCEMVRHEFQTDGFIPLHAPTIGGNEKRYVSETIDSSFVSSVGEKVKQFETALASYVGVNHAVAMASGTAALHICLLSSGVRPNTEVLTQSLSFVATANAITYCGAIPVFIDVDKTTLSLSPSSLENWLSKNTKQLDGKAVNKRSGRIVSACVPMHTFGFVADMTEILVVCARYGVAVVEDAAESLGSTLDGQHAGVFGKCAAVSFNGNKIITTGGGGALFTNSDELAKVARHLSTTAKIPHPWEYVHDVVGYNYRMPNINAAFGLAQLEQIDMFLHAKRVLAKKYSDLFSSTDIEFVEARSGCNANYWLCTLRLQNKQARDEFLLQTNNAGIMTRPVWRPLHLLKPFLESEAVELTNTLSESATLVNIPSSVIPSSITV